MFLLQDVGDGELPETLYLSSENLSSEGIFLLEAGEDAFIYAGKAVSPEALYQLFGVHTVNEIHTNQVQRLEAPFILFDSILRV